MAPLSRDAVIVVPGIMGSELKDAATGKILWGLSDPRWYARVWTSGAALAMLRLTDDERAGNYGRVKATRLLRFPAFAPVLQGYEPYTRLIEALRRTMVHADAVAEFPYDWRLPVGYNANLLAVAGHRHLEAWRRHPAQVAAQRADADGTAPRLVVVAHSMGGLLARNLTRIPGAVDNIRATVTLGTPFYGSVKAAIMLSTGRGAPAALPRARLRDLATRLPGVYDLLPRNRCVDQGTSAAKLSPADVARLGGDRELAEESGRWHGQLGEAALVGHVQVVGAHQATPQSLTLLDGVAHGHPYTCKPAADGGMERVNLAGDGTVARDCAQLSGPAAMSLAQTHGAISRSDESLLIVTDLLTNQRTGPWLGAGEIGIDLPERRPCRCRIRADRYRYRASKGCVLPHRGRVLGTSNPRPGPDPNWRAGHCTGESSSWAFPGRSDERRRISSFATYTSQHEYGCRGGRGW